MNILLRDQKIYLTHQSEHYRPFWNNGRGCLLVFSIICSLLANPMYNAFWATPAQASSQQVKVLEIPVSTESIPKTLTFPLYEQEGIQYFSAGLGKEERSLSYPPFSLKLIFVQGDRAYLAGVSIKLANQDGTIRLTIPGEEVEGPWLFIKIPPGTYVVSGTDSQGTTIEKTITVQSAHSAVAHFRFP